VSMNRRRCDPRATSTRTAKFGIAPCTLGEIRDGPAAPRSNAWAPSASAIARTVRANIPGRSSVLNRDNRLRRRVDVLWPQ